VIELNEAFAAQSLAVIQQANLDPARVNPNGARLRWATRLGAPVQNSRRLLSRTRTPQCALWNGDDVIGGGMGAAGIFERV